MPSCSSHLLPLTLVPPPPPRSDVFTAAMKTVDVTFQNLDSSEISLTDVSHYFDSDPTKLGEWGCDVLHVAVWLLLCVLRVSCLPQLMGSCPARQAGQPAARYLSDATCLPAPSPLPPFSPPQWRACATTARCPLPSSPTPPPPTHRWARLGDEWAAVGGCLHSLHYLTRFTVRRSGVLSVGRARPLHLQADCWPSQRLTGSLPWPHLRRRCGPWARLCAWTPAPSCSTPSECSRCAHKAKNSCEGDWMCARH